PLAIRTVDSLMTNTAVAIAWTDNNYPPAETYTVFYKEKADETDNWKSVNSRNAAVVISELNTTTTYTVEVAANCGKDGNSFNSYPADFTTLYGFPYSDDLTQAPDYIDANGFKRKGINPFNRGFSTATGLLSGRKDILLSMTPAEGTAVKAGSEIMLYTTSDAETGITISYNLYKKGETVPSIFQEEEGRTQHVEASSVKITISEEMTVFARASLKGISNPSNTVKATFTIDENAPDLTLTQTPADLTPAAPLEFVANPSDASAWNAEASYTAVADNQTPRSVGLRESVKTAWLLTPRIFIEEFDMNFPLNIQFKANSAMEVEEDGKKTWVKGNIPEKYTNTKLYVLVSQNGEFSIADTIASIPVAGQTIEDQTFSFDIPGIEGQAQVALYYYNPKANPNAENDPMMLFEVYDFSFGYVGTPCFPLTNLKRSNTTTNEATFSWKGNSAEYMIYWGAASAETYTDSAMTKENTYTLTGLSDYTQYKVQVTGYCAAEHSELAPRNVTATFVTLQE
ncbi:MAG: fibronectin type III domain-containing protein, partial [Bacteroidales bacterium]|nr:fibronectin type III domain-containing protein [Bacteroidales bacterium]